MEQVLLFPKGGNSAQKVVALGFPLVGKGISVKRVVILTRNMTVSIPVYCEEEIGTTTVYEKKSYQDYLQALRERRYRQREQDAE